MQHGETQQIRRFLYLRKQVRLSDEVKNDNGLVIAYMQTVLEGDGSTPVIMSMGGEDIGVGYDDNGNVITTDKHDDIIKNAQKEMMAEAIKEQKNLCVENGVDPGLVNYFGAEKESVNNG